MGSMFAETDRLAIFIQVLAGIAVACTLVSAAMVLMQKSGGE